MSEVDVVRAKLLKASNDGNMSDYYIAEAVMFLALQVERYVDLAVENTKIAMDYVEQVKREQERA